MEEIFTDLLVIGCGLAGSSAALQGAKPGIRVSVVGKFAIGMGTNSAMANGGFSVPHSRFSSETHVRMTLESGQGLNRPRLVRLLSEQGPEAVRRLTEHGLPFVEGKLGYSVDRPGGAYQLPGILLMGTLARKLTSSSVQLLPGLTIFDLVVEEGEARGAFGFFRDGRSCLVHSKAVILATGGGGGLYRRNDNQRSILGDGYVLALRAGLPVNDLEFVQFYPFVLAEPRLSTLMLYPPYPKEMRILNETGDDLWETLRIEEDPNLAIITHRDALSLALHEASARGDVFADFTRVPEERWNHYPLNFLRKSKFPFRDRPVLISPAAHFFMGGVEIDEKGRTPLPGLFAAGEVAWGVHGANRLGGNALTECAVYGTLAAEAAIEFIGQRPAGQETVASEALAKKWERRANRYLRKRRGGFEHPRDLLNTIRDLAWRYAGPSRDEASLKEGLDRLAPLERRIEKVYPATVKDLLMKRGLENGALLLRAIMHGSLLRKESRGSFFRNDFPRKDDPDWQKSSCYRLGKEGLRITHQAVSS